MNIFQKLYCFVQTTTYKKNEQTLSEDDESYTQVKFKKPMSQYYFDNDGGYLMAFFFALLVAELSWSLACSKCFLAASWVGSNWRVLEKSWIASEKFPASAFATPEKEIWHVKKEFG